MKNNTVFLSYLLALSILLICLNSCNGQINSSKETNANFQFNTFNISPKVLDKNIRSIFQDKKGNYWFGTNGEGVYRYDSKTLTQFTVKNGLTNNQILSIQEDELGNMWFGTGEFGVSKFDGSTFTTYTDKVNITKGTESDWKSTNKDLWFFAGSGMLRYNKASLDYLPFASSNSGDQTKAPFALSRYGVYSILKDKNGNLWFGTQAEGVGKYDGKTLSWFKDKGLAGPAVLALFEDRKGNLWFGNNGAGLFLYDGKTLKNFTEEKGLGNSDFRASGKPSLGTLARVYAINEDKHGNIWIGTVDAGVWKYDGNILTNYTTKDGLSSNAVNTIFKDKNGELWFGTDQNGICKFNRKTFFEFVVK